MMISRVDFEIRSIAQARQLYKAMTKAWRIQELDIALSWDVSIGELYYAVNRANVIRLTVDTNDVIDLGRRLIRSCSQHLMLVSNT